MGYTEIVNLACSVIGTILSVIAIHFVIFAIVGVFKKKRYPVSERKLKYGVVIPTRNEEAVIGNLIESIRKNNYPQENIQIFVIAHNCTDDTAKIARELGETVYEYNNSNECTKGYALRYAFDRIKEDYGIENYSGFLILDADNILTGDYISKMNDAFVACGEKSTITSYRHSKNFGENPLSACYGLFWLRGCVFESRGRSLLDCSSRVPGTGFLISNHVVRDGWKYVTLTEDWEFSADRIIEGEKIYYCDDAIFYDEQPTTTKIMWRQRIRWAKGHLLVFGTRLKDLIRSLIKPKSKGGARFKGSVYDIMINVLPTTLITLVIDTVKLVLYMFSPLFGENLKDVMLGWAQGFGMSLLSSFATSAILAIFIYILESKRIKGVSFMTRLLSILLYPVFTMANYICVVVALFSKNLKWKTIPHVNRTRIEDIQTEKND
ncbi:MAG: glycosyltransferase family 2 protein [Clostridia bacterium]|nr:glycosyltransferase family 2 protein [Clostridia bacterium]